MTFTYYCSGCNKKMRLTSQEALNHMADHGVAVEIAPMGITKVPDSKDPDNE